MRVVRLVARLLIAAAAALLITAVFDPAAGLASTQPGFSTQPRVVEHPPVGSATLTGLRAGRHASFDRVVFQLDGPIPSYSVRYVPVVHLDGSGEPLQLRGAAFLEVVVRAPTHDQDGRPVLRPTRLRPDFPVLREVKVPGSFEGQTTAGIGVTSRVGFRVLELANPTRIAVDLAHPQMIDDDGLSGGPRALTVTPARGPVGTRVTVEGRGCGNLDQPVRLVFQNGGTGTVGAVDLGEFPASEQDAFRATAVVIPANMDPLQGVGGGPTRPGTYQFTTRPPTCTSTFTVTSTASNHPDTDTPGTLPLTGSHTPLLLAIGGGLLVVGVGLVLLVRRQTNLAA
jgi:LPXTG-motif cell wall-anchored protein